MHPLQLTGSPSMDPHIVLPCKAEEPEKPVAYTLNEPLRVYPSLSEAESAADDLEQSLGPGYSVVVAPLQICYHHKDEDPNSVRRIFSNNLRKEAA